MSMCVWACWLGSHHRPMQLTCAAAAQVVFPSCGWHLSDSARHGCTLTLCCLQVWLLYTQGVKGLGMGCTTGWKSVDKHYKVGTAACAVAPGALQQPCVAASSPSLVCASKPAHSDAARDRLLLVVRPYHQARRAS